MNVVELVNRGWNATVRFDPELHGGKETTLGTRMPGWSGLSWAEQTVQRALYGFGQDGELVIGSGQIANPETMLAVESSAAVETPGERYALPGRALPGADERLRELLQELVQTCPGPVKYDDSAAVWAGEDQSVIYTCEYGWGMPGLVEREPALYCEFSGAEEFHLWQNGYGQQPAWSIP